MSATEKLKALMERHDSERTWAEAQMDLYRALPQIAAVVEAAEHSARALSEYGYVDGPVYSALTALDKALA